ncbi:hypothetical protein [Allonocardiopsis opalescens]|uniref:Uncharacterized protein n=1 Tax=Allonocardiopsis opalescens TaxID=1144618 RepID=A0A2T0PUA4_9ACTN|nr:hypothetical protein [Allonocardiopsis opalescens]PRX92378.1 hypothetical protein CLV72_110138 [Allonocardiopsis opalescens]
MALQHRQPLRITWTHYVRLWTRDRYERAADRLDTELKARTRRMRRALVRPRPLSDRALAGVLLLVGLAGLAAALLLGREISEIALPLAASADGDFPLPAGAGVGGAVLALGAVVFASRRPPGARRAPEHRRADPPRS